MSHESLPWHLPDKLCIPKGVPIPTALVTNKRFGPNFVAREPSVGTIAGLSVQYPALFGYSSYSSRSGFAAAFQHCLTC